MRIRRVFVPVALAAAAGLILVGCTNESPTTSTPSAEADAPAAAIAVVASTNVYGQVAVAIGGDQVDVVSLISSGTQDPHAYEPSAEDQLRISKAELIIENGGGYDGFVDALIESSGSTAEVVTAVEHAHDYPGNTGHEEEGHDHEGEAAHEEEGHDHADEAAHEEGHDHEGHEHIEGFNEHVWYDPHTMEHVAEDIAAHLSELRPDAADAFTANLKEFTSGIETLESSLADIAAAHEGATSFQTEPLALYLSAAAGIQNVAPDAFTEAVEEGQDVPPATLLESITLLESGTISLVIVNAQTGGAETEQVMKTAHEQSIPVVEFTETLPEGPSYLDWMTGNVSALADSLGT